MNDGRPDAENGAGGGGAPPPVAGRVRPRKRRGLAFKCFKFSAIVFALAIAAALALVIRLNLGPLTIDGIGDKIESALHERFGNGVNFVLGKTSIVQHGLGPSLTIDKLSVTGPDGHVILEAPKAEVAIDPLDLMFGEVVPKRLEVFGVTLRLVLLQNGNLAIAAGDGSKPFFEIGRGGDTTAPPPSAAAEAPADGDRPLRAVAVKQAAAAIRQFLDVLTDPKSTIAAVDHLAISQGTLLIEDRETKEQTSYKDLELSFDKNRGVKSFGLSAQGPNGRWSINAIAKGTPGGERHFSLKAKEFSIDEIRLAMGTRSQAVESDMPFGVHFDIGLNPDNSLSEAAGGFEAGPGFIRNDDPDQEPAFISTLDGTFRWNGTKRVIEVDPIHYVEGTTKLTVGGTILPPHNEGEPWALDLALTEPGVLGPDRKGQEPVPIKTGRLKGKLSTDQKRFAIERFTFDTGTGGFALAGQVDWVSGPHIRVGASMDPMPVKTVKRLWPAFVASPVRAWMLTHFEEGIISNSRLQIDYDETALKRMRADRAPADKSISLDFDVSKGRVAFLDGVPPLDDIAGSAHITGRTSRFSVTSAKLELDGKTVDVPGGYFAIANANHHPINAKLNARLSGSVEAVTNILTRPALKPYASIPLDPDTLHGHVEGTLDKALVMGPGDDSQDVLRVEADIADFAAERLIGKEGLDKANLHISVGDGKLKATGDGRMFGGDTSFEIDRAGFDAPTASITTSLDDAARAKLGLGAVQGISGPILAHVATTLGDPAKMKAQVELDLSKASITAGYLGLTKPAGRPGKVTFTLASGTNRMLIDPISADVGPLQAKGAIDLAPDNSFQSAHFSSFRVSPGDDMKLDVAKADDTFKLTIRGSTIDARPFLKALTSTPSNDSTPISRSAKAEKKEVEKFKGFDIDLKSNILTGFNKEVMSAVDLKLSKRGNAIRQFSVQGRFGDDPVSGSMGTNQRIKVSAADAGALVSFVDLYKHMEGGHLSANMAIDEDTLSGNLEIKDFVLRDEPAIRRLVIQSSEVSAPGQDAQARKINAGAAGFKRLKVNFERQGSRLQLHDATMFGSEIGLSVDGWLDYSHDRVDMNGTFVPAYALNNLFSQIPVFGVFLGGKSNEGLFAITFRITGSASTPNLSINPLSAIAPGIMRNIFGALDGSGRPASGAEPSR